MTLFEVTLEGYDSSSPDTDDRVKWVKAPNRVMVEDLAAWQGWKVTQIDVLKNRSHYTIPDGVDAILDEHGNVAEHNGTLK